MLHQAHAVAPAAIAFLAILQIDRGIDARDLLDPNGGDGRRPHRLDHHFSGRHQLHRLVECGPGRAELAGLLQFNQLVASEVDLLLGHVAFVAVFDQVGAFKAQSRIHDADRRHIEDRRLALEFGIDQILPFRHLMPHQIRTVADRVRVVDLRNVGQPFGDAIVQFGGIGLFNIERFVRRDSLTRNLVTIQFTLGEDGEEIVELLDLLGLDTLDHPALGRQLGLPAFEVRDVDAVRLGDEAIDRGRCIKVLHRYLETKVLGRLIADCLHNRVRHADVTQFDVLDFLRPDRWKARDGVRSHGRSRNRGACLQQRPPVDALAGFACRTLVFRSHLLAPLSIFDTADTCPDQLDGPPASSCLNGLRSAAVTAPRAARHTLMPLTQNLLATVSSERWIDDIGDITYVRAAKYVFHFQRWKSTAPTTK